MTPEKQLKSLEDFNQEMRPLHRSRNDIMQIKTDGR
jgi:hypothetical protein